MSALLSVKDLRTYFRTYGGTAKAVDGVSFDLGRNEIVGLVGETGCGKTVTGLSIMRLIEPPGYIASGSVLLEGEGDLLEKSERSLNEIRGGKISMIFQDPSSSLNPLIRIGEQVEEGVRRHSGLSKSSAQARAIEVLELVGITSPEKRLKDYPHQLSGGIKQRVVIARAIAPGPRILIADEPTTNLDVITQLQVLQLIKTIQKQRDLSVILISHNLGVIAQMCTKVVIMYAGHIVEVADTASLFLDPKHPYTRGLIAALINPKNKEGGRPQPIPGNVPSLVNPAICCLFNPRCPFVMDICRTTQPEFFTVGREHQVSCYLYGKGGKQIDA